MTTFYNFALKKIPVALKARLSPFRKLEMSMIIVCMFELFVLR